MIFPEQLASGHSPTLFNRELSWIAFNRRLLYEVADHQQPVFDRVLKLAQACSALDEYFMMRVPTLLGDGVATDEVPDTARIRAYLRPLLARQEALFESNLRPTLSQQGVSVLHYAELTDIQRRRFHHRFEDEIKPVLAPLIAAPSEVTPGFTNLSLYLAVCLETETDSHLAWIKIPRVLPRFLMLPEGNTEGHWVVVPVEQIIAAYLPTLFPSYQRHSSYPFRVTRSADLGAFDSETSDLMEKIQESLQQRQKQGRAIRLEVLRSMPSQVRSHLMSHLQLTQQDTYTLRGWLALSDLRDLAHLPRPDLMTPAWQPVLPPDLHPKPKPALLSFMLASPQPADNLFHVLKQQDLLLHFPYHSFAATVEAFIAQAAEDPDVFTIKVTLYRTAIDAPIVRSLLAAAKAGKQIVVLVELTAPLDEAINIHWAKSLSKAGAHVVYGVLGYRTHTNLALVVRREQQKIHQYAYIGTGDFLPDRPQSYEDLGLLTSRPDITQDLSHLFNYLTGCALQVDYPTILVAPKQLRTRLQSILEREMNHAQAGKPARIIAKLNLLADPDMIELLYRASQAGVVIDLIVRGICRLRPGVEGLSDRIRVISILGHNVEHSRILYCHNAGNPEAWIGTADWTPRGLDERIEVMVPLQSPELSKIYQRLELWLNDNQDAWILQANGQYVRRQCLSTEGTFSAHNQLMQWEKATELTVSR